MKQPWFFTNDGQYGQATVNEDFVIVDTESWTSEMFDMVFSTSAHDRTWLARHLDEQIHQLDSIIDGRMVCDDCGLDAKELGRE